MGYYHYMNIIIILVMQYRHKGFINDLLPSVVFFTSSQLQLPTKNLKNRIWPTTKKGCWPTIWTI